MSNSAEFTVSVVYALPDRQVELRLRSDGTLTAREAALQSGLVRYFPELDLAHVPIGVFGEHVDDDYLLVAGDRVELYRNLIHDPKESRRRRAAKRS